ncbi:uncharacterized protein METZ01_LOCUS104981 [marine metagenome]|uniref:Uncharacterized protein n=1 Tax=marine metagenome TaxID=408172 RepID=A0A381WJI5_9ZZZZ
MRIAKCHAEANQFKPGLKISGAAGKFA